MCSYIASVEALERFKADCKKNEANLLSGKSQLCLDALLFISPVSCHDSIAESYDENISQIKTPIDLSEDRYLLDIISRCPVIKIIFPCTIAFSGFVDLSLLKSCHSLELVGIPFQRLTGVESLRQNVRTLVWNRGYEEHERGNFKIFENGEFVNDRTFKIDEVFWNQFGSWKKLTYLSFARSSLLAINTSAIPDTITSLNLAMNRIARFNNHTSQPTSLTKLCLDFNQLTRIPKLDHFTSNQLVHLSLRGNVIVSVKDLQRFQSLKYLNLSANALTDIRELLTEIGHLNRCLQTLYIEDNPVCFHKQFDEKIKIALCNLKLFNGRKMKLRKDNGNIEDAHIPVMIGANYGTNYSTSNNQLVDSLSNNEFDRTRRERIVMINDTDESNNSNNYPTVRRLPNESSVTPRLPTKNLIATKNYLFGDVSGSYGSFNNPLELSQNSQNNQHEELVNEKTKLLEKRKEKGENWLLKGDDANQPRQQQLNSDEGSLSLNLSKVHDSSKESEPDKREFEKSIVRTYDDTSEWKLEDTEEDENVFLVETYDTWNNLLASQVSNFQDSSILTQFLFIRYRPEDQLLFEKDCTSGKVLTVLDLKILESFQTLPDKQQVPVAIQVLFDTTVVSKRERIYRFIEDDQCQTFVNIITKKDSKATPMTALPTTSSPKYPIPESISNIPSTSGSAQFSSTPVKDYNLWLYLCLRCGAKSQQIITDCLNCGSPLIVKDVGEKLESKLSTPMAATPTNRDEHDDNNDGDSHESNYTFEKSIVDENYFDADNIDHVRKLMVEVAVYEMSKNHDPALEKEAVHSVCECLFFNFNIKLFQPSLIVFTDNYIFLFEHVSREELKLRFYYPFVGQHQFILSHLPDFMKNHAFWFQCLPFNQSRKRNRKRDKKSKSFDPTVPYLELIMFDDKLVGKAFLEHLFKFHRICYRKLDSDSSLQRNLPVIKPDLTEVIHDTVSPNHNNRIGAVLDEQLTNIIDSAQLSSFNDKDNPNSGPNYFLIRSFSLNLESKNLNEQKRANQDLLKVEQNLLLLLSHETFVLCQLSGHFYTISAALTSSAPLSLAKLLRTKVKFEDHIELRLLMQDCLLNLLPTVYVCEAKNRIILKFRDENGTIMSFTSSFSSGSQAQSEQQHHEFESSGKSSLMVYDFQIDFYSLHAMKRVLELVQNVWERHFGVSLTLSKAKPCSLFRRRNADFHNYVELGLPTTTEESKSDFADIIFTGDDSESWKTSKELLQTFDDEKKYDNDNNNNDNEKAVIKETSTAKNNQDSTKIDDSKINEMDSFINELLANEKKDEVYDRYETAVLKTIVLKSKLDLLIDNNILFLQNLKNLRKHLENAYSFMNKFFTNKALNNNIKKFVIQQHENIIEQVNNTIEKIHSNHAVTKQPNTI